MTRDENGSSHIIYRLLHSSQSLFREFLGRAGGAACLAPPERNTLAKMTPVLQDSVLPDSRFKPVREYPTRIVDG